MFRQLWPCLLTNVQHGHGCSARLSISASTKRRLNLAQAVPPLPALSVNQMGFLPQRTSFTRIPEGVAFLGFLIVKVPSSQFSKNYIASTVLEMEVAKVNGHWKISVRCFFKH